MSLVNLNFESQYLHGNTDVTVILPDKGNFLTPEEFYRSGKKYKVLWLLHGTYGDHTDWIRKSMIEVYATERDLIVVMMSALNTVYDNWTNFCMGYDEYSFVTKELMQLIYGWFPASDKPEDNFIAGLSMGGRGTMKIGLSMPEKFGGIASLSSVPTDLDSQKESLEALFAMNREDVDARNLRTYNDLHRSGSVDAYLNGMDNTWRHFKDRVEEGSLPKMFFSIGTEDPAYLGGNYNKFKEYVKSLGKEAMFTEGPGKHEWRVWDRDIQLALDYFDIHKDRDKGRAF